MSRSRSGCGVIRLEPCNGGAVGHPSAEGRRLALRPAIPGSKASPIPFFVETLGLFIEGRSGLQASLSWKTRLSTHFWRSSPPIWPNWCGSFGAKSLSFAKKSPNCGARMPNCGNRWDIGRPCTLGRCIGPSNSKPRSNSFAGRTASSKINSSVERVKNLRPRIVPITWKARRMIGSPPPRASGASGRIGPARSGATTATCQLSRIPANCPRTNAFVPSAGRPLAERHRGFRTNRCRFPGLSAADPAATLSADLHL